MDQLPDDVLVEVMQHLAVPDLFALRLVCKRLRDLALHRDVWRLRTLKEKNPWTCTVLRLAPCLRKMALVLPLERCHVPYTTKCAVADLELRVNRAGSPHAAFVIRNQEALGRLRRVSVNIQYASYSGLTVLLGALASTAGLKKLELPTMDWIERSLMGPVVRHPRPVSTASLEIFRGSPNLAYEPFCSCILTGHSATLQVVYLDVWNVDTSFGASLAPLMAHMPNLRELHSPLLPGMDALAACASLRDVSFELTSATQAVLLAAAEFFRRATRLRDVYLNCEKADSDDVPGVVGVNLALALASSGKSRVQDLTLYNANVEDAVDCHHQQLLGALPQLPALRYLRLDGPPEAVLAAISPAAAPALRTLVLRPCPEIRCGHAWLHSDPVRAALTANPLLHIQVFTPSESECVLSKPCETCALGCHPELLYAELLCFFSHDPEMECSNEHDVTGGCVWIHIPH
ncbi:uncharacterized protein LOC113207319 [Frankliniella occidentalis]|uniref:Uncharacterized protein LOC113207319 n=1 Tax=Frankliniella occidentalis TaxID=133901 RepID=A0A6J1SFZ2_FRAOC|nr:uncharacterized protein LOC113207319 [Frankliniella occidentalis]